MTAIPGHLGYSPDFKSEPQEFDLGGHIIPVDSTNPAIMKSTIDHATQTCADRWVRLVQACKDRGLTNPSDPDVIDVVSFIGAMKATAFAKMRRALQEERQSDAPAK
jgi:hypothetical protein